MDNVEQIVETTPEIAPASAEEKYLPQTEVNRIVGKVKAEAFEKARRQLEAEYAVKSPENSGSSSVDSEKVYEEVSRRVKADFEREQQKAQEAEQAQAWKAITTEYNSKLGKALEAKEYDDFHDVVKGFQHDRYDMVVYGANAQDNTADIIYHLAKDPERAMRLELLGRNDPKGFEKAMKKFADSVKENKEAAKKAKTQSAPLPRIKSDVVTTGATTSAEDDYLAIKNRYYGRNN